MTHSTANSTYYGNVLAPYSVYNGARVVQLVVLPATSWTARGRIPVS